MFNYMFDRTGMYYLDSYENMGWKMKNITFRNLLPEEYVLVKDSLSKSRGKFYSMLIFFFFLFICSGIFPVLKSSDWSIPAMIAIFGVVFILFFSVIGRSYISLWRRRRILDANKVRAADVSCIKVQSYRSHSNNYKKYVYKLMDRSGHVVELKTPHCLNGKLMVNDECLILNFNNKYYSIYKRKEV